MKHLMTCFSVGSMSMVQIPNWFSGEDIGSTKDNPFPLPDAYMAAQQRNVCFYFSMKQSMYLFAFVHILSSDLVIPFFFYFHQLKNFEETRRSLKEAPLEENRKRELSSALHVYFKDWLYGKDFL